MPWGHGPVPIPSYPRSGPGGNPNSPQTQNRLGPGANPTSNINRKGGHIRRGGSKKMHLGGGVHNHPHPPRTMPQPRGGSRRNIPRYPHGGVLNPHHQDAVDYAIGSATGPSRFRGAKFTNPDGYSVDYGANRGLDDTEWEAIQKYLMRKGGRVSNRRRGGRVSRRRRGGRVRRRR